MSDKHNLLYFEGSSMRELFDTMQAWQQENGRRLLSANIEKDGGAFCCIALTNPMDVCIYDSTGDIIYSSHGYLHVTTV